MPDAVQVAHLALLALGVGALVTAARRAIRTDRWRNPLRGARLPAGFITFLAAGAALLAYLALQFTATIVLQAAGALAGERPPGSPGWHALHAGATAAGAAAALLMASMLRVAGDRGPGPRPAAGLGAALLGLLVLLPLLTAQAEMGRIVWTWVRPASDPPLHEVLRALRDSAWGAGGTLMLVVGAVLVAPVAEELFFRGLLLEALCGHLRRGWAAIAVSSIAFGIVHAQPQDVLPLITMGVLLGYLRLRLGAVWPCIVLHVLFNARTMTFAILAPELLQ